MTRLFPRRRWRWLSSAVRLNWDPVTAARDTSAALRIMIQADPSQLRR